MFKDIISKFSVMFQKVSFWFLLIFLFGVFTGTYCMNKYVEIRMKDAIALKGIVINNVPYDLKERFVNEK